MSFAGLTEHFIPSDEDKNWNAEETEEEFWDRCMEEMSSKNSTYFGYNNASESENGNQTMQNVTTKAIEACNTVIYFKKYGLYGGGYTNTRQLMIIAAYR